MARPQRGSAGSGRGNEMWVEWEERSKWGRESEGGGGEGRHNGKAITALRSREKLAVFSESESLYVKIQK